MHLVTVMMSLCIRSAECDGPPLPQRHAELFVEHLPPSKLLPAKPAIGQDAAVSSSEKAAIKQETAASCDASRVTKSPLHIHRLVSTDSKEPVTLPESDCAGQMRDTGIELQQRKDASRLVFSFSVSDFSWRNFGSSLLISQAVHVTFVVQLVIFP